MAAKETILLSTFLWEVEDVAEVDYILEDFRSELETLDSSLGRPGWVIAGTLGLWNGTPDVFKVLNDLTDIIDTYKLGGRSIEDVVVKVNHTNKAVRIDAYHHDGVNRFELYVFKSDGRLFDFENYEEDVTFKTLKESYVDNAYKHFKNM